MGIDWQICIRIHSPNESELDELQENFLRGGWAFDKEEGWVRRTPNLMHYNFRDHTVGLSASRIMESEIMDLYLLGCIVREFPSCYVKGFWYADSGYTHEYIAYWDSTNERDISKYIGYEGVDEDFYRHFPYEEHVNPSFRPNTTELYKVNFFITGALDIEEIRKCFPLEQIKRYAFHSDYVYLFYLTNKLDFEWFYSLLRKTSYSYLKVDWERIDKTLAGIWVGNNRNGDITHHSISFLPEPQEVYIDEAPTEDELHADQMFIDEEAQWECWWWMEKSDNVLEDIRYTYRCDSIWHTYTEPKDMFSIPSLVGGYWYLKHRNGDVFHSEDEGIIEYLKVLSEHDVYADIEKEEQEDITTLNIKST